MIGIIPSINVQTFAEVQERVARVEPYVSWCHLDVTDGVFSKHPTWRDPADLEKLDTKLNIEVHLMVQEPEKVLDMWLAKPVKRVIVHLEAVSDMDSLTVKCHEAKIEIGVAINPETPADALAPWLTKVALVQVLTVSPGPSGQTPDWPKMLDKVMHIHAACPQCIIEVDGGINPDTAKKVRAAGATLLVAGSYIFNNNKGIQDALSKL